MKGEGKAAAFWVAIIVLAAAGWLWYDYTHPPDDTPVPTPSRPPGAQEVRVGFELDGDSLQVTALAPGKVLSTTDPVQIRLLGIDAPEMHGDDSLPQCWAEKAKAQLTTLAPPGSTIWVQTDLVRQDKYQRFLVYAWTPKGQFINESLATAGNVRPLNIPPNDLYRDVIEQGIDDAKSAKLGLWGNCPA